MTTNKSSSNTMQSTTREVYPLAFRQCFTIPSNYQPILKAKVAEYLPIRKLQAQLTNPPHASPSHAPQPNSTPRHHRRSIPPSPPLGTSSPFFSNNPPTTLHTFSPLPTKAPIYPPPFHRAPNSSNAIRPRTARLKPKKKPQDPNHVWGPKARYRYP